MASIGSRAKRIVRRVWSLATYGLAVGGITNNVVNVTTVNGDSMQPTLNPDTSSAKDVVLIDRFNLHAPGRVRRGDVVIVIKPSDPGSAIIKRVAAMPGDQVSAASPDSGPVKGVVPQGHCWLDSDSGDRRSVDSLVIGVVPIGLIVGRAVCVVWPPQRLGTMLERREPDARRLQVRPASH